VQRDARDHDLLAQLLRRASRRGDFTLASGKKSDWYLDCREVTTTHSGLHLVAGEILGLQAKQRFNALGGPASAAIASMAGAVALAEMDGTGNPCLRSFVFTRARAKEHGTQQQVDGAPLDVDTTKLLLVDDVLTSGGSLLKCRDALLAKYPDLNIVGAWVLVDRAEGGRDRLTQEGLRVWSAFTRLDILAED